MHVIEYPVLLDQVKAAALRGAADLVTKQMSGKGDATKTRTPEKLFAELHDINYANHDKVWYLWRELCADEFFRESPDVTDVFVIENGSPKKHWIASSSEF